jgi:histone-lysine N-methyltransferase SUV420H
MAYRKAAQGSLTLDTAMLYENIITASLVDQVWCSRMQRVGTCRSMKVHFCGSTRKFSGRRFKPSRGPQQDDVRRIIASQIVSKGDLEEAIRQLSNVRGMLDAISEDDIHHDYFRQHLKRYASMYMSDCPFNITATERYKTRTSQSSVTARSDIEACKTIKYLAGVQVVVHEHQEESLASADNDFSLVVSSRRNTCSLLLGPIHFANHDCNANARLAPVGTTGVQVISMKPISRGDEITVDYGDDYFGKYNKECLCSTCEHLQRNGWAASVSESASQDVDVTYSTSATRFTRSMTRVIASGIMPDAAK